MICEKCGKSVPDGSQFCDSCGATMNNGGNSYATPSYSVNQQQQNFNPGYTPANFEVPVTAGGFFWRMLLLTLLAMIPLVGGIIDIVILGVWKGDKSKQETYRNWAKCLFIWQIVAVCLSALLIVLFAVLGFGIAQTMSSGYYF